MSEPLDVLMVGCGRIAGGFDEAGDGPIRSHAGAYRAHGGFRLAACVEPDDARREAFRRAWDVPLGFATLPEALESGLRFDVASVCSPTADHARDLAGLLPARPRAVLCEKPLTAELDAARRVVAAYGTAAVPLCVNHLRRYDRRLQALKDELAAGAWGGIRSLIGLYNKGVLNNGSHLIDLVGFLFGPLEIVAVGGVRSDGAPGDPTIDALLRLADGTPLHLVGGDARDYAVFELTIVAEGGVLALEDSGYRLAVRRPRGSPRFAGYRDLCDPVTETTGLDDAMVAAWADLRAAALGTARPLSDGASALAAQETCEGLRSLVT